MPGPLFWRVSEPALGDGSVRRDGGPPLIEIDYSFMRTGETNDVLSTVLLAYTTRTSYGFAAKCDKKGPSDHYALNSLLRWLNEQGLGTGVTRLRSDSEVSIRAVATAIAASRRPGETMVEVSPVHSSSSLGAVERWSQSVAGLVRTLLIDAGRRLKCKFMAKDALFAWAVRHAAFLHNRFQALQRGPTPFEQVQRQIGRAHV